MKKIKLDLSKSTIKDHDIFEYAEKIKYINDKMNNFSAPGFEMLGWKDLAENYNMEEFRAMEAKAKELVEEQVELLVVIGIGGSFLGAKAAIDFIKGEYPVKNSMEVMFAGTNLSSTDLYQKLQYADSKKFAICVISKSGKTLEPSIAFREFRLLLERKIGPNNASKYIVAITDANNGLLAEFVRERKYTKFILPENIGGRFSVLTPVGIFPMLCAGIDALKVIKGAAEANQYFKSSDLDLNDAYKYAVARHLLHKRYPVELLVSYENSHLYFLEWWRQLFGESEGKLRKGVFPSTALFTRDLHSIGQFIQDGSKVLYETVIWVERPKIDISIEDTVDDLDQLNYLIDTSVHNINRAAYEATVDAHFAVGSVPNIQVLLSDNSEESLGALFMFFERAVAISAYLLDVNPFDQPGVEVYKNNMNHKLKK
ncbi:glucose-6-phosphate isomerase [Mycoplasmopsis agassizii]|uniref:Glucose-6-phosphate isomerase n=1 Tax=Mycoplasmopsis agassizii TaxID=33922 RepID=A0A269TK82_9BACT|nr:glucose-6-phosphate isomerase [Mycoplasmopsis agassizii]PAK21476.1 glucose-6-phosphate isomerase [Mycoplasmopsis agassizii]